MTSSTKAAMCCAPDYEHRRGYRWMTPARGIKPRTATARICGRPPCKGFVVALVRSLAFICPACSVGAHAGTPAKMVCATRVPNRYGGLTEGHCVQRSGPRRGSIDHAIYSLACKFWHQLSTVAVSCSPCLADL